MILDGVIERLARALAARRLRRDDETQRRREARWARREAQRTAFIAYEQAHAEERLELARQLMAWASDFTKTDEARWARERQGYAWVYGWRWLYVDDKGRLWRWGERHWFGSVPDKLMDSPESLARSCSTESLRQALRYVRRRHFWWDALWEEVAGRLGLRGKAV